MRLYTEEQVRDAIDMAREGVRSKDGIIDTLNSIKPPIELPSDEDIKGYIKSIPYYGHCTSEYCEGIEDGIKWTLDKIQGGNK